VAFSPDGGAIAAGAVSGTIRVWDARSRQLTRSLGAPGSSVNTLAFDPHDNALLFAGGEDNRVVAWDLVRGMAR
jgi:WD40 repeat protein